jgi:leucyl-tRNA synthetase
MPAYNFKEIEQKWQKYWADNHTFQANEKSKKPKYYALVEFPYPSGDGLHVGHPRPYTGLDVVARKKRAEGYDVLYPFGWDAFGLPTENYAIKTGVHPSIVTKKNTDNFRRQTQSIGFSFDWSREVNTTDPSYYKWTQWIFLQLFKHGLAYKAKMPINWCPKDKIGLANEEVVNGCCERCGTAVEKREKEQWMLAITKYADRLIDDLDTVDYVEQIKTQQKNWIGRSEGAEIVFALTGGASVTVFTTRPDTLFGATYLVLSPEHELVAALKDKIKNWAEVENYCAGARKKSEMERTAEGKEKTGVELQGVKAVNPANGEEIPVWIADYVLAGYGTGAIMAVPAHDDRDFEFAQKFKLPIKEVVAQSVGKRMGDEEWFEGIYAIVKDKQDRVLIQYDKRYDFYRLPGGTKDNGETDLETLNREFAEETGYTKFEVGEYVGQCAVHVLSVKNSDKGYLLNAKGQDHKGYLRKAYHVELLSNDQKEVTHHEDAGRFDYHWMTHEEAAVVFAKNSQDTGELRLIDMAFKHKKECFAGEGIAVESGFLTTMPTSEAKEKMITWLEEKKIGKRKVQYKLRDWVFSRQRYWGEPIPLVWCAKCNEWVAILEKQLPVVLPNVEKYQPTDNGDSPLAPLKDWVNTKCPKCGGPATRETDTMPNWAGSSWYFLRYCDPHNDKEFASAKAMKHWMPIDWYNGGMEHTTLHLLYSRFWHKFLWDIGAIPKEVGPEPYKKRTSHGLILAKGGVKMSKSKGNVVNPDEIVGEFGADVFRTYEMFMGPFDQAAPERF